MLEKNVFKNKKNLLDEALDDGDEGGLVAVRAVRHEHEHAVRPDGGDERQRRPPEEQQSTDGHGDWLDGDEESGEESGEERESDRATRRRSAQCLAGVTLVSALYTSLWPAYRRPVGAMRNGQRDRPHWPVPFRRRLRSARSVIVKRLDPTNAPRHVAHETNKEHLREKRESVGIAHSK